MQNDDTDPTRELPIKAIGLDKALVKSWRTRVTVRGQSTTQVGPAVSAPEGYEITGRGRVRRILLTVHLYLDPANGVFYARVPETNEGSLFAARSAQGLREQLQPAVEEEAERVACALVGSSHTGRVWERLIIVQMTISEAACAIAGQKPQGAKGRGHFRSRTSWVVQPGAVPTRGLQSLLYYRVEQSPRADGHGYEVREWQEDYEERLRQFEATSGNLSDEQKRQSRPTRSQWWWGKNPGQRVGEAPFLLLPYSAQTWERLGDLAGQIDQMVGMLHDFVAGSGAEALQERLIALPSTPLLTAGPSDVP